MQQMQTLLLHNKRVRESHVTIGCVLVVGLLYEVLTSLNAGICQPPGPPIYLCIYLYQGV